MFELMYIVATEEKITNYEILCDKASCYLNMAWVIGGIVSPNLSGMLADTYGYRSKCEIMSVLTISFALFFFFTNVGFKELFSCKKDRILDCL